MEWIYFLIPFLLLGVLVVGIAFRGGAGAVREAATGGGSGGRGGGFRILMIVLYVTLGIAVPAAVIASREEARGGVGPLERGTLNAEAREGKRLFEQSCASCHNLDAVNARGATGPDLDEIGEVTPQRIRNAIKNGGTGQKRMPAELLEGEEADAVAVYVSEVAGR
jgi:mono/diheme cytochrome c family protein